MDSAPARAVFATLSLIRRVALLAGYLQSIAAEYGVELIDIDAPALTAGVSAVVAELVAEVAPSMSHGWDAVPVRFTRSAPSGPIGSGARGPAGSGARGPAGPAAPDTRSPAAAVGSAGSDARSPAGPPLPPRTLAALADVFRRAVALIPNATFPADAASDDLSWLAWDSQARRRLAMAFRRLPAAGPQPAEMERLARTAGVPFGRACAMWETADTWSARGWPSGPRLAGPAAVAPAGRP